METNNGNSFLQRLKKGELSLAFTFWVVAVLGDLFLLGIVYLANQIDYSTHDWAWLERGMSRAYFLVIGYGLFAMVAVWRCGDKYKGGFHWVVFARLTVLFATGVVVFLSWLGLGHVEASRMTIAQKVEAINSQLPKMVDEMTRMDVLTMDGDHINNVYTLIHLPEQGINVEAFQQFMGKQLRQQACSNKVMREFLDVGKELDFYYKNADGDLLASYSLHESDCVTGN